MDSIVEFAVIKPEFLSHLPQGFRYVINREFRSASDVVTLDHRLMGVAHVVRIPVPQKHPLPQAIVTCKGTLRQKPLNDQMFVGPDTRRDRIHRWEDRVFPERPCMPPKGERAASGWVEATDEPGPSLWQAAIVCGSLDDNGARVGIAWIKDRAAEQALRDAGDLSVQDRWVGWESVEVLRWYGRQIDMQHDNIRWRQGIVRVPEECCLVTIFRPGVTQMLEEIVAFNMIGSAIVQYDDFHGAR